MQNPSPSTLKNLNPSLTKSFSSIPKPDTPKSPNVFQRLSNYGTLTSKTSQPSPKLITKSPLMPRKTSVSKNTSMLTSSPQLTKVVEPRKEEVVKKTSSTTPPPRSNGVASPSTKIIVKSPQIRLSSPIVKATPSKRPYSLAPTSGIVKSPLITKNEVKEPNIENRIEKTMTKENLVIDDEIDIENSIVTGHWHCLIVNKECKFKFHAKNKYGNPVYLKSNNAHLVITLMDDDNEVMKVENAIFSPSTIEFKVTANLAPNWYQMDLFCNKKLIAQNSNVLIASRERIEKESEKLEKKIRLIEAKQNDSCAMGYEKKMDTQLRKLEVKKQAYDAILK